MEENLDCSAKPQNPKEVNMNMKICFSLAFTVCFLSSPLNAQMPLPILDDESREDIHFNFNEHMKNVHLCRLIPDLRNPEVLSKLNLQDDEMNWGKESYVPNTFNLKGRTFRADYVSFSDKFSYTGASMATTDDEDIYQRYTCKRKVDANPNDDGSIAKATMTIDSDMKVEEAKNFISFASACKDGAVFKGKSFHGKKKNSDNTYVVSVLGKVNYGDWRVAQIRYSPALSDFDRTLYQFDTLENQHGISMTVLCEI